MYSCLFMCWRCHLLALYRDVPNPEELATTGNFISKIADNAEELIDYAYTFIPPREGARNSRRKKRMEHRRKQTVVRF